MTKGFDRSKLTVKEFSKAFKKLCDETPTMESTCRRIRKNQQLYLEYQQKCLYRFDPDIQQAIEHAGDIIRELAQSGCKGYDLNYIDEKIHRLNRRLNDLSKRRKW